MKFKVSKPTIIFKIALSKLISDYPKIKKTHRYSFIILKKHLKMIKKVHKENASEFKQIIKFSLNLPAFSKQDFVLLCLMI